MNAQDKNNPELRSVAREILDTLKKISEFASQHSDTADISLNVLANANTMIDTNVFNNISRNKSEELKAIKSLRHDPAIARMTVVDIDNPHKKTTLYISRSCGIPELNLTSYRAPIGRLLARDFDETITTPGGAELEAIEKIHLHPVQLPTEWDSKDNFFLTPGRHSFSILSLRSLLSEFETLPQKTLDELLKEEEIAVLGMHRSIITQIELRNQPILDRYQDDIFRLPINSTIILLGAPGTGKTTTLIKRVGLKLDENYLDASEKSIVNRASSTSSAEHSRSWMMFSPTELLRLYVKEAFSTEGIPAPDRHIKTWFDYVRELNRDTTRILNSTFNKRGFSLESQNGLPIASELSRATEWFAEFEQYQQNAFLNETLEHAARLASSKNRGMQKLGLSVEALVKKHTSSDLSDFFLAISRLTAEAEAGAQLLDKAVASFLDGAINLKRNKDGDFLDNLVRLLAQAKPTDDTADDDDDELDEDDEPTSQALPRKQALTRYRQALKSHAKAIATGRKLSKGTTAARIIEWAQNIHITPSDLLSLGRDAATISSLNMIRRCVTRYFRGIPKRYRSYRKQRMQNGGWHTPGEIAASKINAFELDILTLSYLSAAHNLHSHSNVRLATSERFWSEPGRLWDIYRHQVLADEATDFSPIQLACMTKLTHPLFNSFFASGDLNQRVTVHGTRTTNDLLWAIPNASLHKTPYVYRQTRKLFEFTRALLSEMGNDITESDIAPTSESEGISPALRENCETLAETASWIACRIREIEMQIGMIPSIAIFSRSIDTINSIASELEKLLGDVNITVEPCPDGRVKGQDSAVRIFDIKHIKGLEFEAAFFAELDEIALENQDIFDKYLYVGATRASTHLGITCKAQLPVQIAALRNLCVDIWGP